MARASQEMIKKAERMFRRGKSQAEIARAIGVSYRTVCTWRKKYEWKGEVHRGAPKGNRYAAGASGNPHPNPPPDRTKHGAYSKVYLDALQDDEKELIMDLPVDEENMLMEQVKIYCIRERRIMKAIRKYMDMKESVVPADVVRTEEKRTFASEEEKEEYENMKKKRVETGDDMPGNPYSLQTRMTNKDNIILRLEAELSSVQRSKVRTIESLTRIRAAKARAESEKAGDSAVDEWLASVLEADPDV